MLYGRAAPDGFSTPVSMCSDATAVFKAYNNVYLGGDLKDLCYTHFFFTKILFYRQLSSSIPKNSTDLHSRFQLPAKTDA